MYRYEIKCFTFSMKTQLIFSVYGTLYFVNYNRIPLRVEPISKNRKVFHLEHILVFQHHVKLVDYQRIQIYDKNKDS